MHEWFRVMFAYYRIYWKYEILPGLIHKYQTWRQLEWEGLYHLQDQIHFTWKTKKGDPSYYVGK